MQQGRQLQNVLLISALAGLFVLAVLFDLILRVLAERNTQLGGLDATLVWIFPLLEMLLMVAIIGLIWLMISGKYYSRWISVVYLIAGLIILYTNPILFVNELPDSLYVVVQYLAPGTILFQAGGSFAAIGLLSLWFWREAGKDIEELKLDETKLVSDSDEGIEDPVEI